MFDIEYKGGNGVVISTKKTTLVIDPKLSAVGLKDYKGKVDVSIATEATFAVDYPDAKICLEGPGEYEVGDFTILGVAARRHIDTEEQGEKSTIYRVEVGDVKIALVGNVAQKLNEDQLEAIGVVDVVIVPVGGGGYTLDAMDAATVVRQIEPKVVIPIHYAETGLKYEVPQDSVELFIKEMGAPVEKTSKWKLKNSSMLPIVLTVVELQRS